MASGKMRTADVRMLKQVKCGGAQLRIFDILLVVPAKLPRTFFTNLFQRLFVDVVNITKPLIYKFNAIHFSCCSFCII